MNLVKYIIDDVLYSYNTDGSGQTRLFDFSDNAFDDKGMELHLRPPPTGEFIYFSSTNASFWTPAGRNMSISFDPFDHSAG